MSVAKHANFKFKKYRRLKVDTRPLDDFLRIQEPTSRQYKLYMRRHGLRNTVTFEENPIDITTTEEVVEPYVPKEGDGRSSFLSDRTEILDKARTKVTGKVRSLRDVRLLKKWEETFNKKTIASELQNIYIESQKLLQDFKNNKDALFDYVTEHAYTGMTFGLDKKTFRWEFVESVEPPKLCQVRVQEVMAKSNLFAQLTIRMHTRQKLAIYDRFGRIMYGSEHLVKDVLEYIVFEKHIVNEYGRWRVHAKILPKGTGTREPLITTIRKPKETKPKDKDEGKKEKVKVKVEKKESSEDDSEPKLAVA